MGRFAPSPTGPLHAGSLVAAMASYLDARAHGGRWLLRIEDLDPPREVPGASAAIIDALARLGFGHDGPILYQSTRDAAYRDAFERLRAAGHVYPCACTRREVADSALQASRDRQRHAELVYPGTCRAGMPAGRAARAWRVRVDDAPIAWHDRRAGAATERLDRSVGDFVLRRADGLWAYQLAVVVDDAFQRVTDVVRGADLRDSTARQIHLQQLLGLPTPRYLHVPVLTDASGNKLSKQTGATPIDTRRGVEALNAALASLELGERIDADSPRRFWPEAIARWARSPWMGRHAAAPTSPRPA
ncbi:MAG: tRNA glutamyl-Q(34) synthetase GluQRS [Burkholderiaceae bacterium]|nr:tRNA glutamyl-Q(34) synthetase GluQRS [Burkholderiaceae bacterium]